MIYQSSEIPVERLVERSAAEEVLKMEYYSKISWSVLQWEVVEHNIGKREFYLPNNCVLVTKLQSKILSLQNQEMKSTICLLNEKLTEAKKMLADNQLLVSVSAHLSKLKSINKR